MSNTALLERPATVSPVAAPRLHAVPRTQIDAPAPAVDAPPARSPRGFALYVGIDELKAATNGVSLPLLVDALRRTLAELAPDAETHATVARDVPAPTDNRRRSPAHRASTPVRRR